MNQFRSLSARIFLTEDQSRLRAGWRLLIAIFLTGMFFNLVDWVRSALSLTGPTSLIISRCIDVFVVTSALYLTRRFVDKRSFASLGLDLHKRAGIDVLMGIAIAFVLMLAVYGIEYSLGWLTLESFAWQTESQTVAISQTLGYFFAYLLTAWHEELVYRGYILQTLASGLNLTWAILISSVYFGVEHLSNPNSSWMAAAGIFFIALLFIYGFVRTGQLWLPIGLHIGWNFFQSSVFGFPVSGLDRPGLLDITVSGPELWTGGEFGPEAGIIILPICVLGAVLVHIYTKHHRAVESKADVRPAPL